MKKKGQGTTDLGPFLFASAHPPIYPVLDIVVFGES
jgi:hypothetical protein